MEIFLKVLLNNGRDRYNLPHQAEEWLEIFDIVTF